MITEQRKANLAVLADYLESLPKDYAAFEMDSYFEHGDDNVMRNYQERNGGVHACGAVACAVGHGPAAGFLFTEEDKITHWFSDEKLYDWGLYCGRVFLPTATEEWSWCFGPVWADVDNTPHGAAARIRYMLAGGQINFDYNPNDYNAYLKGN